MRGVLLLDGDNDRNLPAQTVTGEGLQFLRWHRYEIESYLLHPKALVRFIKKEGGDPNAAASKFRELLPAAVETDPQGDHPVLEGLKAGERLPPILSAGGVFGADKSRFFEIAALMQPEEIHPEVHEKLNLMIKAFGL